MILSKSYQYGLRSAIYLADALNRGKTSKYIDLGQITSSLQIPHHFVSKILQQLTRAGILISSRGLSGGFKFKKNPDEVTVLNVIEAIDGVWDIKAECFLGISTCSSSRPCPLHSEYEPARKRLMNVMNCTIGSLGRKIGRGTAFLSKGQSTAPEISSLELSVLQENNL